jgi:hypothetical protein
MLISDHVVILKLELRRLVCNLLGLRCTTEWHAASRKSLVLHTARYLSYVPSAPRAVGLSARLTDTRGATHVCKQSSPSECLPTVANVTHAKSSDCFPVPILKKYSGIIKV